MGRNHNFDMKSDNQGGFFSMGRNHNFNISIFTRDILNVIWSANYKRYFKCHLECQFMGMGTYCFSLQILVRLKFLFPPPFL